MNKKARLLAAHFYFDFTWDDWNNFLASEATDGRNPFETKVFRCFPGKRAPSSWQEALQVSNSYPVKRLTRYDPEFPPALAHRGSGCPVLYMQGEAPIPSPQSLVAVVGTRFASPQAIRAARQFAQYFCDQGMGVVSGLARGIDSCAHLGALDKKGFTIAVLGSSLEQIYPSENTRLAQDILELGGLLLSEFPPGAETRQYFFPRRNAVLAALSAGIVVVEAPPKSGAQITAKFGLANDIPVIALPKDFWTEAGVGACSLIQIGAWPACTAAEALEGIANLSGQKLISLKDKDPLPNSSSAGAQFTFSNFCLSYQLSLPEALQKIEELKMAGVIETVGPENFRIREFRAAK